MVLGITPMVIIITIIALITASGIACAIADMVRIAGRAS